MPSVTSASMFRPVRRVGRRASILVAALVVASGAGVVGGIAAGPSNVMAAMAAGVSDPMSLIDGRSPGMRAAGALLQTKMRRVAAMLPSAPGRARHAPYSVVVDLPPPTPYVARVPAAPAIVDLGRDAVVSSDLVPPVDAVGAPGDIGPPVFGGGGFGGGVIGGGGGILVPPVVPVTPVVPVVPPAAPVPEPATWMMMLVGFGLVGATMRGRLPAVRLGV